MPWIRNCVVVGIGMMLLAGCRATEKSTEVKETRYLPKAVGETNLKYFREADENRLFIELNGLMERWERASLRGDEVVQSGVQDVIRRYVVANYGMVRDALRSENPRFRIVAAATIGFAGRADAVPMLFEMLEDDDDLVLSNAMISLVQLSPVRPGMTPLIPLLSHEEAAVRSNALMVLSRNLKPENRDPYSDAVIACLGDDDGVVRLQAAAAAARLDPAVAAPALSKLTRDPFPKIRIRAAVSLADLGDPVAIPDLVELLGEGRADVRDAALASLERLTGEYLGQDVEAWKRYVDENSGKGVAAPN